MEGKKLGERYQIIQCVGGGGMAKVYKARDLLLDRYVAVKVMSSSLNQDLEFVKRFMLEAKATARLSHPNVVLVHDVGLSNHVYYMVMEFIEGHTLKDFIKQQGHLSCEEAINVCIEICKGLSHAHKNGIIHRDIKPHNIMCTPSGAYKVADFGISRFTKATTSITKTGNVLGSIHYMSPEQVSDQELGYPSDLYSLGIVLYEMLTGEVPYNGKESVSIALKHMEEPLPDPRKINPKITEELYRVIQKTLEKDVENRFQTAEQMIESLEEALRSIQETSNSGSTINIEEEKTDLVSRSQHKSKKEAEKKSSFKKIFASIVVSLSVLATGFFGYQALTQADSNEPQQENSKPETEMNANENTKNKKTKAQWEKEFPKYYTNDVFRYHKVSGSKGEYDITMSVSNIPTKELYYNVYSIGEKESKLVLNRVPVKLKLDEKKQTNRVVFHISVPKKYLPKKGITKVEFFWLEKKNGARRDRIENLLEKF